MEEIFDEVFASDSEDYAEFFDNQRSKNDKKQKDMLTTDVT